MSILDYGDILYVHCTLYSLVGWTSFTQRHYFHMFLSIYKAFIGKLLISISCVLAQSAIHATPAPVTGG